MTALQTKEALYKACEDQLAEKYAVIQEKVKSIVVSLNNATKSSAGDKHETTRAMLQLEREQAGERLLEIEKIQPVLFKINVNHTSKTVHLGSLVTTNKGTFFLSISLGVLQIENCDYFCIGLQTPIGKLLFGKQAGDTFVFRDTNYTILSVY